MDAQSSDQISNNMEFEITATSSEIAWLPSPILQIDPCLQNPMQSINTTPTTTSWSTPAPC
jgi:hypothetical protein